MSLQSKKTYLKQLQDYYACINSGKTNERSYTITVIVKLLDEILQEEMLLHYKAYQKS